MLNLLTSIEEPSGYQAIKAEGWKEGERAGEAAILLHQAERKFGPLSESTRARIAAADANTLLLWSERILTANGLEALLS